MIWCLCFEHNKNSAVPNVRQNFCINVILDLVYFGILDANFWGNFLNSSSMILRNSE